MTDRKEIAITQNLTIEDIFLQAVQHIKTLQANLIKATTPTNTYVDAFAEVEMILVALPLNTAEFSLAGNRLRNAARYLKSGECGAACYELKLLARNLANNRHHRIAVSQRRSNNC